MRVGYEVTVGGGVIKRRQFDNKNQAHFLTREYAEAMAKAYRALVRGYGASELKAAHAAHFGSEHHA